MSDTQCQVTIHIQERPIRFLAPEHLSEYVDTQRKEGGETNSKGEWIETWQNFDHFPLLKVVDDESGEEFVYNSFATLPRAHVVTKNGKRLLSIGSDIPEPDSQELQAVPEVNFKIQKISS